MTTYPPTLSFPELLATVSAIVVGRVGRLVEEWPDPCRSDQRLGRFHVSLREELRGRVPERFIIRIAGPPAPSEWTLPMKAGAEVLLLMATDPCAEHDPPDFLLQHAGCFRVRDDMVELPEDLELGGLESEGGRVSLARTRAVLDDLAGRDAEERAILDLAEPEGWRERPYPEVREVRRPDDEGAPAPREGRPARGLRPRESRDGR